MFVLHFNEVVHLRSMNVYGVLCLKGKDQFEALVSANYQFYGRAKQQEGQSARNAIRGTKNLATPVSAYCNPWVKKYH